jgi:citrate lyase beta subunit
MNADLNAADLKAADLKAADLKADLAPLARSYLFVPGNRPDRFAKAFEAGAGAVITAAINDDAALRTDFDLARACGFGANMCIHPRQIATVHAMLAPTPEQRDWAARVLAAAGSGTGTVQVDGKMVDRPVLPRASAILNQPPAAPAD